jgi:hypothetical protein
MVRPLSNDLPERAVKAVESGESCHAVAARFDVAVSSVVKWRPLLAQLAGSPCPNRLVFIDETWIKTNMAPLRGWGSKRERLRGFAPHGHWRTLTFLGCPTL